MATSSSVAGTLQTRVPFWLWPNLLSLDAPLIAALWQDVFAHDAGVRLTASGRAALPLSVWLIYLVDRLLDTRVGLPARSTARHAFYYSHRGLSYWLAGICAALLALSVVQLPRAVVFGGAVVAGSVGAYLLVIHWIGDARQSWVPKEAAVGLLFTVGCVLAPLEWAEAGGRLVFPALVFGILCWMNSAAIEIWEGGCADRASRWVVGHMRPLAAAVMLTLLVADVRTTVWHSDLALALAAIGYWLISEARSEMNGDALRVWIDVPLLAPLLFMGLR